MITSNLIIIASEAGSREIFVSPFLLQFNERPNIKSGPISRLYFYEGWNDEEYKANLQREMAYLSSDFMTNDYIIYYGQDFSKYYIGCLEIDPERKSYRVDTEQEIKLKDEDAVALGESIFNTIAEHRRITLFTPTRPSDFNLGFKRFEDGDF